MAAFAVSARNSGATIPDSRIQGDTFGKYLTPGSPLKSSSWVQRTASWAWKSVGFEGRVYIFHKMKSVDATLIGFLCVAEILQYQKIQ